MPSEPMQDSSRETVITLPDPWTAWPWTRRVNQFHDEARTDSTAWVRSYKVYSPEAQRAFELCDNCLLVSLAYPDVNAEQLRLICDLLQFLYVFDDRAETADEQSAQTMASAIMSGLRDGSYLEDDVGAAMARDFWQRLIVVMPNQMYQRRLVAATQEYTDAVVQEARDHNSGHIPTVPEYFALRRKTSAIYPFWVLLHIGLDLPEAVFDDQRVQELEQVTADALIICNDIVSYKPEVLRGQHHNIIAVLKEVNGLSVQEAMDWAGSKGKELMLAAQNIRSKLPTFGGNVDHELALYVEGMFNWVRACDSWSFDGQRYFGEDTPSVRKSRQIVLRAG